MISRWLGSDKSLWSFGFQHMILLAGTIVYPVLLGDSAGVSADSRQSLISYSLVAGGIASILLSSKRPLWGTGLLLVQSASAAYLLPSISAVKKGGIELVFGMTLIAAFTQLVFSRILPRLRTIFTVEISGVVIMMVGFSMTPFAISRFAGSEQGTSVSGGNILIALITLFLIIGFQIWGRGGFKRYAFLIGMSGGYLSSFFVGTLDRRLIRFVSEAPILMFPEPGHFAFDWHPEILIPFLIVAITTSIKVSGDVLAAQKLSEPNFKRPDLKKASRGIFASGMGNFAAAMLGGIGGTTMTGNVGFAAVTKILERRVARYAGILMILLAFFPKAILALALMPSPVLGATLLLLSSFVIITGMQVISSRVIDSRKSVMIGLSLLFGLSVDMKPEIYRNLPEMFQPIFQSSLSVATLTALFLNSLFRIGVYKRQTLKLQLNGHSTETIDQFLKKNAGLWGVSRDALQNASAAIHELLTSITLNELTQDKIKFIFMTDEHHLIVDIIYKGKKLPLEEHKPSQEELLTDESSFLKLSGYMIRQMADATRNRHIGEFNWIRFIFLQ